MTVSNNPELCDHTDATNGMCDDCDEQVGPITVTLQLAGIPSKCPHCNMRPEEWALALRGVILSVTCPHCWTAIAPVRAAAAKEG